MKLAQKKFRQAKLDAPHATATENIRGSIHALSFSRRAQQLHVTQPALSKIVREIEEVIGVQLFERTTRRGEMPSIVCNKFAACIRQISSFDAPELA